MISKTDQIQSESIGSIHLLITRKNALLPDWGNTALHMSQQPEKALEMRKILAAQSLPLENWILPLQKHTDQVWCADNMQSPAGALDHESSIGPCDGLYTTKPGRLLGVFTADCLGILLADPSIPLAAAVHSGWKGTAGSILYKHLEQLKTEGLLHPETLHVFFAPSLQWDSLEIGPEVRVQLEEAAKTTGIDTAPFFKPGIKDRSYFDNQRYNLEILRSFHIPEENLHPSNQDTKTDDACFSYRRDGKKTGEHFSCIWIESEMPDSRSDTNRITVNG